MKSIKDKNTVLLANTNRQPLKEHSLAVAFYSHLLLKSLKFKSSIEKEINKYLIYSALLHDIGKVSNSFQEYIKENINKKNNLEDVPTDAEIFRKKTFNGPFHNEISWAYIENFICFKNDGKTKKTVCHSVYWHHPANWDDKRNRMRFETSEDVFKEAQNKFKDEQLIEEIYKFLSSLSEGFSSSYGNHFIFYKLEEPDQKSIERIKYPQFFAHDPSAILENAKKQLCLNLLLEADRSVSRWSLNELRNFLKEIEDSDTKISDFDSCKSRQFLERWGEKSTIHKVGEFSIVEDLEKNKRSKEQSDLAEKMANNKLSVCGVDPAGGKTSIALYWWNQSNKQHSSNYQHPLMITLPRQHQVTGMFKSLDEDSKRVYGKEKIKIEAVFNGQRQENNWGASETDELLNSDINILVFDRFLSPYYKRSQSSEFIRMLRSHLVLDEFHEFVSIPKMIPSLKEILNIRKLLDSGVKTLMLSGTPEPAFLKLLRIEKEERFKRKELSERKNHKFKLSIYEQKADKVSQSLSEIPISFRMDCLYSFLKVEFCQKVFARFFKEFKDQITLIHTYFTLGDKKNLLKNILKEHGKLSSSIASEKSVVTSKMLQSSYDLSFRGAILETSQPSMDCQTAGRINRFGNKLDAEIHFIFSEESEKFFDDEKRAGFLEIHKSWKKHLSSFIEKHKEKHIPIRELMKCYDGFWIEAKNIEEASKILKKQQETAIEELNQYIPKRFISGKKNAEKKQKSVLYLNNLFRGESRLLSACVVNDDGKPKEPYQLYENNLLGEGRKWLIEKVMTSMESCLKTKEGCKKANKINGEEIFEYNKYIKKLYFGFKAERPLLCSHFNSDIDNCFQSQLKDDDTTEHRVYNERFGLVKKSLLTEDE